MTVLQADEQAIFNAARLIADTDARREYLVQTCGNDHDLQTRVEALLRVHEQDRHFLSPTVDWDAVAGSEVGASPGTTIGPYKLIRQIGEGGMGNVFLAEQEAPVRRQVAVKVLKPGMDSRQIMSRFAAERQALAVMDHPNIAKVHDAGTTPAGRPYFVMELVSGTAITKHCDHDRLTLRQRLDLFVLVCRAVQHAHQKGIIHRDLKPANILIAEYDGKPAPKVIDFGVAKAIGNEAAQRTDVTEYGVIVGSLEYMSPEQSDPHQQDIDTRSDVYALGVLLYELLTGTTPLMRKRVKQASWFEVLRMIRDEDPPKPSTRIETTEELATIAANRGIEPKKLSGLVRGDLDWIVMKCLEKDRSRRYESASGLARDIERYLSDEPVEACPPSPMYRLTKFARRNRAVVVMVGGMATALLIGATVATWQAVVATNAKLEAQTALGEKARALADEAEQRELAEDNERKALAALEAEKAAKSAADRNAAETRAVLNFVERNILSAARPAGEFDGQGHSVTLRDALRAALPAVEKRFANQPLTEARLRMTMGFSFEQLGEAQVAVDQYTKARTIFTAHLGDDHELTLQAGMLLGNALSDHGNEQDAVVVREQNYARLKAKYGPDHPQTLASMSNLANSLEHLGKVADAIKLREETLPLMKAKLPPNSTDLLGTMGNLANSYRKVDRLNDALLKYEEALTLCRTTRGPEHSVTLTVMSNLATAYAQAGRHADALQLREEALAGRLKKHGPDHPETLSSMNNLSYSLRSLGRYEEALKLAEEALALRKVRHPPEHPAIVISMQSVANSYAALGRYQDAFKMFEDAIDILNRANGPTVPARLAELKTALAWVLVTATDEKSRDAAKAVSLTTQAVGTSPKDANVRGTLGAARYRAGDWPGAIADLEHAIRLRKADDPANAREGFFLAMAHRQRGETQEASTWFAKSVAWLEKVKSADAEFQRIRAEAEEVLKKAG